MKATFIRIAILGMTTKALLLGTATALANQEKTLRSEFERIVGSVLGGELLVSCGDSNTFKITSGVFGSPKLHWKSGIEWQKLEGASFKEAGVLFDGLAIEGGVPLKDLKIDVDLPIFNSGTSHNKKTKRDYFIKSKEAGLTPYEYTLDVVRGRLTLSNTQPITDYIRLDVEKYTREQSTIPASLLITAEQKFNEEVNRQDREDAIKAAIEKYNKDIEVVTPARKHQLTQYCTLEK